MIIDHNVVLNSPALKKYLTPDARAFFIISLDNPVSTGKKLRAIVHKINKTFSSCDIMLCDSLNRFNLIMSERRLSEDDPLTKSLQGGDAWLNENANILDELTIPHKIIRWDRWRKASKFKDKLNIIKAEYTTNLEYQQAFYQAAEIFLSRRKLELVKHLTPCIAYLQEECAVMLLWADYGYTFELYTSKRNLAMAATYELLIKNQIPNVLIPVIVDVKLKAKQEQEIVNIAFETMLNSVNGYVHIYVKDEHSCYLYCNKTQANSLAVEIEDIIGKTDYDFFAPDTADKYRAVELEIMQTGIERVIEEDWVNGEEYRIFLSTKVPLFGRDNRVIGILGISVDITDQKNLQRAKQETLEYQNQLRAQELFKKCFSGIQDLLQTTQTKLVYGDTKAKTTMMTTAIKIKLSRREEQILYLLSLNKSTKEIADILGIIDKKELSFKTILSIINKKLYVKFEVFSVSELVSKARASKLIPFFPESFVNYEHLII